MDTFQLPEVTVLNNGNVNKISKEYFLGIEGIYTWVVVVTSLEPLNTLFEEKKISFIINSQHSVVNVVDFNIGGESFNSNRYWLVYVAPEHTFEYLMTIQI